MMSLSRVFKKPSSIVYQDVVSLKQSITHPAISLDVDHKARTKGSSDVNVMNERDILLSNANIEAKNLLKEAQLNAQKLEVEWKKSFEEKMAQEVKVAKQQAYADAYQSYQEDLSQQLKQTLSLLNQKMEDLMDQQKSHLQNIKEEVSHDAAILAISIARKVLQKEVELDSSILKELLYAEMINQRKLSIVSVEISKQASQLFTDLEDELTQRGIDIHCVDEPIDHMVLVGKMGSYDCSIYTQLKAIEARFME